MSVSEKKILTITAAVFIMTVAVIVGMFTGGFFTKPSTDKEKTESSLIETAEVETTQSQVEVRSKNKRPEKIRAAFVRFDKGFSKSLNEKTDYLQEADRLIGELKGFGFNSLVIKADSASFDEVASSDFLESVIKKCESENIYTILDFKNLAGETADLKRMSGVLEKYNFDALVLNSNQKSENENTEDYDSNTKSNAIKIKEELEKADPKIEFWIHFEGDIKPELLAKISSGLGANVWSDIDLQTFGDKEKLVSYLTELESKYSESNIAYLLEAYSENTKNTQELYSKLEAILTFAQGNNNCLGGVYGELSTSVLLKETDAKQFLLRLSDFSKKSEERELRVLSPVKKEFITNESKISFAGSASPAFPLLFNGKEVKKNEIGDFLFETELHVGENIFIFEQNSKKETYKITYNLNILKSAKPTGKVQAPGGAEIRISAVAIRGAQVFAQIGSGKIKLTEGKGLDNSNEEKGFDTSSDFVTYYADYTLPASKAKAQNLGNIKISASYNGLNKSISTAVVEVLEKPTEATTQATTANTTVATTAPPTTTKPTTTEKATESQTVSGSETVSEPTSSMGESGQNTSTTQTSGTTNTTTAPTTGSVQSQQLTPYAYAGVPGKSRMCKINIDYCETMGMTPFNDRSNPFTTPLLKGTFDYIDGESSYDGNDYYNLRSGKRVYRKDVEVIPSGYNLPPNKIGVISCTNGKTTDINLSMLWKVPINSLVKGQSYGKFYNDREYGVESFTGNSIEFVFSHTNSAGGNIDLSGSNVFSKAEWSINSSNNTAILRLYFRRSGVYYGYNISYKANGSLLISLKNKPASLAGYTVMLDPGHGGGDPGALCVVKDKADMKHESQINLAVALEIRKVLKAKGAKVIMTRESDVYASLESRRLSTYAKEPDLFISIHCDSVESAKAKGTSAYYYYAQSYPLADAIRKRLLNCYSNEIGHNTNNRNTVFYPFHVIRTEVCPTVLIELGFISNPDECRVLQDKSNQAKLANAVVAGITDYIS